MSFAQTEVSSAEGSRGTPYLATVSPSWDGALDLWGRIAEDGGVLPFQQPGWLEAWRETVGRRTNLEHLAVTIKTASGRPIAALPLVRETCRLRRIGFADGGLSDYNAPILSKAAPQDATGALLLWRALVKALPAADVIRFERMPPRIGSLFNPFAMLPGARPSAVDGLVLAMPDGYEAWRKSLPRRYRMELGRCARLFDALPNAAFDRVATDGTAVFAALETLQRERIAALGLAYALDDPDATRFYRRLFAKREGAGVLTALAVDGEIAAALFGLRHGVTFTMLRIGASPALSRMSPARDLITRTMESLAEEGVTAFDFGLGDYVYTRKLGGMPHHLVDLVAARSPWGVAEAADFRLRAYVRRTPRLRAAAQKLRWAIRRDGQPPSVE